MVRQEIMKFLFVICLLNGCAYDQFPVAWKNIYVKDHDFHDVTLCDVIDAIREDSLPALEHAGLYGYSVILNMDVSQEEAILEEEVFSPVPPLLTERRFSLHLLSQPLAEAFKLLGQELGLDVYYENGIVFLKEKPKVYR